MLRCSSAEVLLYYYTTIPLYWYNTLPLSYYITILLYQHVVPYNTIPYHTIPYHKIHYKTLQCNGLHLVTTGDYASRGQAALTAALADELRADGRRPYVIPVYSLF